MFQTVVVGADDSETARQAVLIAADIAQFAGGKLHIVTAYDAKAVKVQDLPDEFRYSSTVHPADVLLQGLSREVSDRGLEPVVHARDGQPSRSNHPNR